MGCHLHIDAFAGIAGDMFLAACVDLGAPLAQIEAALGPLPLAMPWRITVAEVYRHGIRGLNLDVEIDRPMMEPIDSPRPAPLTPFAPTHHHHDHSHDPHHAHAHASPIPQSAIRNPQSLTTYRDVVALIDALDAPARARDRARRITEQIGRAEAHVHGLSLDDVHFHEVGAIDSIVDMLGAAVALELLEVDSVSSSPLPIGRGFVRCAHGTMPLPAPATAEILGGIGRQSVPSFGVEWEGETVTPTGAAIVAALADGFGPQPAMRVRKVGYGAGDRDPATVPNLLRLMLGEKVRGDL